MLWNYPCTLGVKVKKVEKRIYFHKYTSIKNEENGTWPLALITYFGFDLALITYSGAGLGRGWGLSPWHFAEL